MMNSLARSLLLIAACSLLACTTRMPLDETPPITKPIGHGIAIFKLTTQNEYTDYELVPDSIAVVQSESGNNGKTYTFGFGEPVDDPQNRLCQMYGSLALPAGGYRLDELTGRTSFGFAGILPVRGLFSQPVEKSFTIDNGELVYLGHIRARLIEKTSDDQHRAGPVLPVIDQLATGLSDGTLVFDVLDDYEDDITILRSRHSLSADLTIRKAILD